MADISNLFRRAVGLVASTLSRRERQGSSLFPSVFILCAKILGNYIRKDNGVHGITISDPKCKTKKTNLLKEDFLLFRYINMDDFSLFRYTNIAGLTSCE